MIRTGAVRRGGVAGLLSIAVGVVAMAFERGPVRAGDPAAAIVAHYTAHQGAVLAQSTVFVLGAAFLLWFTVALSRFLAEPRSDDSASALVLLGGATSVALTLAALGLQVGLASAPASSGEPALVAAMNALFTISGLPLAVLLAAVAAAGRRTGVLAGWLVWLSAGAAVTQLIPVLGLVATSGPLSSGGWLAAYLAYPLYLVWLASVSLVMVARGGPLPGDRNANHSRRAGITSPYDDDNVPHARPAWSVGGRGPG